MKYWDIKDKSGNVLHTYAAEAPIKFGGPWADCVHVENLTKAKEMADVAAAAEAERTRKSEARARAKSGIANANSAAALKAVLADVLDSLD